MSIILDDPRYSERHPFRGWNIRPTVLQEHRLFAKVFPELTKAAHEKLARSYAGASEEWRRKWIEKIAAAEKKYGDHGPLISAGLRDHWPPRVKDTVRRLAHGTTELREAAQAHWKAAGKRGDLLP